RTVYHVVRVLVRGRLEAGDTTKVRALVEVADEPLGRGRVEPLAGGTAPACCEFLDATAPDDLDGNRVLGISGPPHSGRWLPK
ncbi:hypothetical protein, partial [Escherichia coli]|uniref:hypothetical protein n=1 Tax=Escherichia coli TaxID=562 RepID=UPI001BE41683